MSPNEILITRSVAPFSVLSTKRECEAFLPCVQIQSSLQNSSDTYTQTCQSSPSPRTPTQTGTQGVGAGGKILSGPLATSITNTAFPPVKCGSDLKLGRVSSCFREAKVTDLPKFPSSPETLSPGAACCGRAEPCCLPGCLSVETAVHAGEGCGCLACLAPWRVVQE